MTTGFIANSYFDSDVIFSKKIFFWIFSDFFYFDRVPPMKMSDRGTVMQQVATIIFEKRPKMTKMGKKWPFLGEKWPFGPLFRGKLHPDHA
jgi:hypothetical protein